MSKKWYQSWTIWFNVIVLVIGFINQLAQIIPFPAEFLAGVAVIGNLFLRFKTIAPIE